MKKEKLLRTISEEANELQLIIIINKTSLVEHKNENQ